MKTLDSEAKGKLAIVNIAALDLRRLPDHRAELRSQLLLGEIVRCLASDRTRQWVRVENRVDRYRGWVRSWGLMPVTAPEAASWLEGGRLRVVAHHAEVRASAGGRLLISPVFFNTRLAPIGTRKRSGSAWRPVRLPDGRSGWIPKAAVRRSVGRSPRLALQVGSFLGVPYLWGGRTPLGFDCSGFVQQLLASRGIRIPRDADQQYRSSQRLGGRDRGRSGDLLFFGPPRGPVTHVGVHIGSTLFAHARGWVRINSVDPRNRLYDKALMASLRAVCRPLP